MTEPNPDDDRLLDVLIASNVVSFEVAEDYRRLAKEEGQDVTRLLVRRRVVAVTDVHRAFAEINGWTYSELSETTPDPELAKLISPYDARRFQVAPVRAEGNRLVVAVTVPSDIQLVHDVRQVVRDRSVLFTYAPAKQIKRHIDALYSSASEAAEVAARYSVESAEADTSALGLVVGADENSAIIRLLDLVLNQAIADGVTDVHLQPEEHELLVRFRIDSDLETVQTHSIDVLNGLVNRVKILSRLDISVKRLSQDGRFTHISPRGEKVDVRVNITPTVWGEAPVLRLLGGAAYRDLETLGFSAANYDRYSRLISRPSGLILASGPMGSGKSATLGATLVHLLKPTLKAMTIEDPVEQRIEGVEHIQVQSDPTLGVTFVTPLRATLRRDANIILVGEIRDLETAETAIQAANIGRLVLSTVHANTAALTIRRLTDLGIPPYKVVSSLSGTLAQRLCKKLCESCKEPYEADADHLASLGFGEVDTSKPLYRPVGCSECRDRGYSGRLALHEVLVVDEEIESLILDGAPASALANSAAANGMRTLRNDGWEKIARGLTTVDEVLVAAY